MSELQAQLVTDGQSPPSAPRRRNNPFGNPLMASIINGESAAPGDRDASPQRDGEDHRDEQTPERIGPRGLGGASQGGQSNTGSIDVMLEMPQNASDTEWLEQCLANVPVKLRAKLMDSTPELQGFELDWQTAGEGAWSSCQQVANATTTQNNLRMKAAVVWVAANFDCQQGHRDYGAARLFHRLCCAHTFGQYVPPEGPPSGTELAVVPPGIHQGSLHPEVNQDFRDILTTMGEVMQTQSAANLNLAIDNIAKLLKPKFDATALQQTVRKRSCSPWKNQKWCHKSYRD